MNTPAGWYPDPYAPGQMRYWDGQVWTQQTALGQPDAQQAQDTGAPGYAQQGYEGGAPAYAQDQSGYAQGQPGAAGYAPGQLEPKKKSPAVWIVSGLAALLVALIVVVIVLLTVNGDDSDDEGTGAADESGDDAVTDDEDEAEEDEADEEATDEDEADEGAGAQDDALEIGESLTVDLAEDDEAVLDMTVEESGVYTVALSADAGTDPFLEVHDANGLLEEVDSLGTELFLLPGDYELRLSERFGDETSADVEVDLDEAIDAEEVEAGDHDFSFGRDGHYVAVVDVPDDSEVTIDVRADNGDDDAVLDVVLPDGGTEYNDDRRSSDPDSGNRWDPYLEFDVDEGGPMVIIVTGYSGESVEGEMSLEIN